MASWSDMITGSGWLMFGAGRAHDADAGLTGRPDRPDRVLDHRVLERDRFGLEVREDGVRVLGTIRQVQTRTVIGMAFMMATAGTMRAAQMAPLPTVIAGAPSATQVAVTAGVEGATWGAAELAMLDIGDMASGATTQASSLPDYLLTMLVSGGVAAGSALLAHYLGGRSAKYLDQDQRSRGQALAVDNPQLTPIVDKLRGAAPGSTVRVRINSDEAYAMREAGLSDAATHRALREQLKNMPEVEVDVKVIRGLDEPAPGGALK